MPSAGDSRLWLLTVRLLSYLTNHVIARVPSFTVRHAWYEHVVGLRLAPGARIHLGCNVWIYGPGQVRRTGAEIGAHTWINRDCCLDVRGGLRIGDDVSISPEVTILTAWHPVDDPEFRVTTSPVEIGDNVFVGTRATIMPGVTIGRGAVIAAGAVVPRDVPPLAIVAGVPARQIGTREESATHYTLAGPRSLLE